MISGPIAPVLIMFALPTLGSSALQSANGSIDAIWVGRLLGNDALAATTNGNLVMFLLTAFIFGFGIASTIMIGQFMGRGDIQTARRIVGTGLGAFIPLAVVIAVLGWIYTTDLLSLLRTPADALPLARDFLRVIFISMPAVMMMTMIMMALRGAGDSMTPFYFMALAVVLDIGLNPVFILGLGPFPQWGIAGSAFATALANYISLFAMLVYIYARDLPLRLRGDELRYLRPQISVLKLMITKGLPMGIQMIILSSSMLSMLRMINAEGVDTTAAFGATQQVWAYVQMPAMSMGAAVTAMVAQNIGAGRWDRINRITWAGVWLDLVMTGLMILIITLIDYHVMSLFIREGSDAIAIAQHIERVGTWGFMAMAVNMVIFGTVRGNGQVIWPVIILAVSMFPVRLGIAYGTHDWLGVDSIWWSFPFAMVSTLLMALVLYFEGSWRKAPVMHIDGAVEEVPVSSPTGVGSTAVLSPQTQVLETEKSTGA